MTYPPMDSLRPAPLQAEPTRGPLAAIAVGLGAVLSFVISPAALHLLRETLHFNCSWGIGGEWGPEGTWVCADGIGYLGIVVVLGGATGLLLVAGLLLGIARPSLTRSLTFVALAGISLPWTGWWTVYGATFYTGPRPADETGLGLWASTICAGLSLCVLGLLGGAVGVLTKQRWSPAALWGGAGLMVVGTLLQPGLGVTTLVGAGLLAAAGVARPRDFVGTR